MIDCFARLGEPRRPWVDLETLKQKFLTLSNETHPDRFHQLGEAEQREAQARSAELNAAYQCLREPKDRLRHLLELERGTRPGELQEIPPALMDLFQDVIALCRQVDVFLAEKAAVNSPLLKVQVFVRGQVWSEKLTALQQRLSLQQAELSAALKGLDEKWMAAGHEASIRAGLLGGLEELYRLFSYFGRWQGQLQERFLRLAL
jgi:DnaJ-domain-containing protein 1